MIEFVEGVREEYRPQNMIYMEDIVQDAPQG
jgi:hypothetical protein